MHRSESSRPVVPWDWHAKASWGQRMVAGFPVVALIAAGVLFVVGTAAGSVAPAALTFVPGTAGARLVALSHAPVPGDGTTAGGAADYGEVAFDTPSGRSVALQGSTADALPPYAGWASNGDAGPSGTAVARDRLLHLSIGRASPILREWSLTTTGTVPDYCALGFDAPAPPGIHAAEAGVGELVMAVQSGDRAMTGGGDGDGPEASLIEIVRADGQRFLQAGYTSGSGSDQSEHVLKQVPWDRSPLQVAIETDGLHRLEVWVNGSVFLDATGLHMDIASPFRPDLEVRAAGAPYTVAFDRYTSTCGDDVVVDGVPPGTRALLAGRAATAVQGRVVLTVDRANGPVTGNLELLAPRASAVRFARHTYWPGDRYAYRPGS